MPTAEAALDGVKANGATGWNTPARIEQEIADLAVGARDERAEALGEILSQDIEFITDFMGLLSITPGSHPNTYRVMHIANLAATFAAMHFKRVYERPRPSQICPALMPPIPGPGHSSFPSGHGTQAYLIARCVNHVIAASAVPAAEATVIANNVNVLAGRIARNRELAGLHYRSDTLGGQTLANQVFTALSNLSVAVVGPPAILAAASFANAVNLAHAEWV